MKTTTPTIYLHGFSGEGKNLLPFARAHSGDAAICINMPGFGGSPIPDGDDHGDILAYTPHVWRQIRQQVPEGKVRLVGHSHGTMIGFALALLYPDDIESLELICPVASPRMTPYVTGKFIDMMRTAGVSDDQLVRLLARQWLVDRVTRYSLRKDWSPEVRQRIIDIRRSEARHYSPILFDFIYQTRMFKQVMADAHVTVPTRICYVSDDNVSGKGDYQWYQQHANVTETMCLTGGHLCVLSEPERIAAAFKVVAE